MALPSLDKLALYAAAVAGFLRFFARLGSDCMEMFAKQVHRMVPLVKQVVGDLRDVWDYIKRKPLL